MHPFEEIDLQDCPLCQGAGCLEEEGGWCVYVQCLDCGCRRVARHWNLGKVIYPGPGD